MYVGDLRRLARLGDRPQLDMSPLPRADLQTAVAPIEAAALLLGEEGAALTLQCVQVQVQVDHSNRTVTAITPGELLLPANGMRHRIKRGVDFVIDDANGISSGTGLMLGLGCCAGTPAA